MRKIVSLFVFAFLLSSALNAFAETKARHFESEGEVVTVDPMYGQVTIRHDVIRDFMAGGSTSFYVTSPDLLKPIRTGDLVEFSVTDTRGDARIDKIKKVGQAPPKEDKAKLGEAVQTVIVATGELAKGVTSPIEPANQVVSGAADATSGATGSVLKDVSPQTKKKF
ncbi:MAG: copper-binding protein [Candidatus Omnitrophica bacterium]|nr:copper-binding protein [Candidatus Omnitrophota bacterium]